jgi:hypothetical protein
MKSIIRWAVFACIASFLPACMTVEGPDSKYVLTKEGFKEVDKKPVDAKGGGQSTTASGNNASNQTGSNWTNTRGYCYRQGRKTDPVPWTSIVLTINEDIDVVYPKILREFKFDRKYLNRINEYKGCDIGLRFDEVPGSHYQIRSYIEHKYGNEESKNTIEIDLSKEGPNQVRLQISYYSGLTVDKPGYEASLKQRLLRAIGQ